MLKSDKIREKDRKEEVKTLLGELTDERIAVLMNLAKKITDFQVDDDKGRYDNVSEVPFYYREMLIMYGTIMFSMRDKFFSKIFIAG